MPLVSIIIPTHDRPQSLRRLLLRLREQTHTDFEVVVVDDASTTATVASYPETLALLDERFRIEDLPPSISRGRPSITRNHGVRLAQGDIVAFCDDDDLWIRDDHLAVAVDCIRNRGADLFLAGLAIVSNDTVTNHDWYADSRRNLERAKLGIPGTTDLYLMPPGTRHHFLIGRTPHANTMVMPKSFFEAAGPYWEKVAFAEDHDLAYRLFANARSVIYRSTPTATLDASPHPSVARTYDADERSLFGILATLRAATAVPDAKLRAQLRNERAWRMLEIAQGQANAANWRVAREFAAEALRIFPSASAVRLYARSLIRSLLSDR